MEDGRSFWGPVTLIDQLGTVHGVIAGHEKHVVGKAQVTLGVPDKLFGAGVVLQALDLENRKRTILEPEIRNESIQRVPVHSALDCRVNDPDLPQGINLHDGGVNPVDEAAAGGCGNCAVHGVLVRRIVLRPSDEDKVPGMKRLPPQT